MSTTGEASKKRDEKTRTPQGFESFPVERRAEFHSVFWRAALVLRLPEGSHEPRGLPAPQRHLSQRVAMCEVMHRGLSSALALAAEAH